MYLVIAILAGVALGITVIFGRYAISDDETNGADYEVLMKLDDIMARTTDIYERLDEFEKLLAAEKGGEAE